MGIAGDLIIIIIAGLIAGIAANTIKIPPLVGYILAGAIIVSATGGISPEELEQIELLAEIGVALLLFSIGLDFSFRELKAVKGIALAGTPLQVLAITAFGFWVGGMFGMSHTEAVVFGMLISLSSTMVVLKTLTSRGIAGTLSAKVMTGVLIVQDLAAIPMMLIIPSLGSGESNVGSLSVTLATACVILVAIIIAGMKLIPWLLKYVAKLNSRELFLISVTAISLGVGYITYKAGLSLAFGAFVAGMVISESDYSRQALADIVPLRDIFGLVFFTSVGMMLDISFISANIGMILLFTVITMAGKFVVFFFLPMLFKYKNIIPLAMGFGMSQIGEFSFVLARTGLVNDIISRDFYSMILSVVVITMIVSPFASLLASPIYKLVNKRSQKPAYRTINIPETGFKEHIIIAGGGRVGFQLGLILQKTGFQFVVVEHDFRRFEKCKAVGFPTIYGEANQDTVLTAAGVEQARLIMITIPFVATIEKINSFARSVNSEIKIIARAEDMYSVEELYKMNIYEVVQPEFEAGIEMIRQAMALLDVPLNKIHEFTNTLRREYKTEKLKDAVFENIRNTPVLMDVSWFTVAQESPIAGKSIKELEIRSRTGVSVVSIFRDEKYVSNPDASFTFDVNDTVAVIGLPENKAAFENTFIKSKAV